MFICPSIWGELSFYGIYVLFKLAFFKNPNPVCLLDIPTTIIHLRPVYHIAMLR